MTADDLGLVTDGDLLALRFPERLSCLPLKMLTPTSHRAQQPDLFPLPWVLQLALAEAAALLPAFSAWRLSLPP